MNTPVNPSTSERNPGAHSLPSETCHRLPIWAHLRLHLCAPQLLVVAGVLCVVAFCGVGAAVAPAIQSYLEDGWREQLAASENELTRLRTAADSNQRMNEKKLTSAEEKHQSEMAVLKTAADSNQRMNEKKLTSAEEKHQHEKQRADYAEKIAEALAGQLDQIGAEAKKRRASIKLSFSGAPAEVPALGSAELKIKITRVEYDGPVVLVIRSSGLGIYYCKIPTELVVPAAEDEVSLFVACNGSRVNESASGQLMITALGQSNLLCKCSVPVVYNSKAQKK